MILTGGVQYFRMITVVLLLTGITGAAPVEEWNRTYNVGRIYDVQETQDEGYILAAGDALVKTDAYGTEQRIRKFNRPELASREFIQVFKIEQSSDGGYILAGSKSFYGDYGAKDVAFVIKTDAYGNEQWSKTFDENIEKFYPVRGEAKSVQQTSDSGYILAESLGLDSSGYVRVIKFYSVGKIEWIKNFEKTCGEGSSVLQTPDGGYLLATCNVYKNNTGNYYNTVDALLIKLDAKGNELWNRTFGENNMIGSIQLTSDGYILAGVTDSYDSYDAWLIKTDLNGDVAWSRTFGETNSDDGFHSVQKTQDGGYILAGYTGADRTSDLIRYNSGDAWLVKVDANGNKQWDIILRGKFLHSARQTRDGGYILVGYDVPLFYGSNVWLVKVSGEPEGAAMPKKTPAFEASLFFITLISVYIKGLWRGK